MSSPLALFATDGNKSTALMPLLQELRDLLKRLLMHNPSQRLGALKGGADDVKNHPWFVGFDWEAFTSKRMSPVHVPKVLFCPMGPLRRQAC